MAGELAAQRRRMYPAGVGVEQAAGRQRDAGAGLGLLARQAVQQVRREGLGQLGLAPGFRRIERQLQDAAGIPVVALLQVLEQAAGVAEAGQHQLRQRGAMGGQLEVEHALGVARGFLGHCFVALQQGHLPAARGQAGGRGAAGQAGADDQCCARFRPGRTGMPGLFRRWRMALETPAEDFPLLAVAGRAAHGEAGLDQVAAYRALAGEGGQAGARGGQPRQLLEQRRGPHLRILVRGETVEEPDVDARIQLRQHLQRIADQQGEDDPTAIQHQALEAGMDGPVLLQQLPGPGRQLRPQGQGTL